MSSNNQSKNLWCRDARAQYLIDNILGYNPFHQGRGAHVRSCTYGESCRGAHSLSELQLLSHISKWNKIDKSTYNFLELHEHIIDVINRDKIKIKSSFEKFSKINEMNFIELINFWHDLACKYRKISKEIPRRRDWKSSAPPQIHTSGYVYADDVPGFYLDDKFEDNAWAIDRITRKCSTHTIFRDKVLKREQVTIWDMCLGENNCKEGVHYINEQLCINDFLNGKCECETKVDFDSDITRLNSEIEELEKQLESSKKVKQKEKINNELYKKKTERNEKNRMIHYTDVGMKPHTEKWIAYCVKKVINEERKSIEAENNKPSWDHKIEKTGVGKVIKVSLKK